MIRGSRLWAAMVFCAAFSVLLPVQAQGERGWAGYVAGDGGGSVLTTLVERSLASATGHLGLRIGARSRRWGIALHGEQTFFQTVDGARTILESAFNFGPTVEHYYYQGGRLRSAATVGISILAFDNSIDDAGTMGLFIEVRPVGLRWKLGKRVTFGFDPLFFAIVAPVLRGIPLISVQYRHAVHIEWSDR